jgi:hypothetical protein
LRFLVHEEGCLLGNDRLEFIRYQGARATSDRTCLLESAGAYLTWMYCLIAQHEPKDEHILDLASEVNMPEELRDRKTVHWLGGPKLCREVLVKMVERELADLRAREAVLRVAYEEPDRAGAEVRQQVLFSPDGLALARLIKMHDQEYQQAYQAFLRGRKESQKTGRAPGGRASEIHTPEATEVVVPAPADVAASAAARQRAAADTEKRRHAAAVLAPNKSNGIGTRIFNGDAMRYAAVEANCIRPEDEPRPGGDDEENRLL